MMIIIREFQFHHGLNGCKIRLILIPWQVNEMGMIDTEDGERGGGECESCVIVVP